VLSGVDQMPFNPNYALPQVATTALRFFMVELLLHVAYITEYVFYLKAAADNPTAKFSAREEFFDFTRLLDLFMIVGFFGTFAKVMLLDEPEDWPRVPRIDAMGEDTREPEDGFHAFFATTATHVFLALHIVHFVSAGFFRGSRRFYHGHGSIFTVFEGAVVLTLFTLCVCGGLWWYGERTMGGRFDSIPSGMLYALLYLVGEWLTADFRSNLGVILCVVQCLVGLVFFGILVGVVQDMLQDLLEHYVKYRDDQDWSHTRQYWLDREKMARGLELDANIKRRYSYLDDLREAVAAEKRGYLGAFGLGDPEGIEEKGKEGTSNDEADIYDEYWYGGHWDWKGYYGDEQWKFLDWRDGWDGQEEEEDADELDIKDVTDETEDDAARRKTTTLESFLAGAASEAEEEPSREVVSEPPPLSSEDEEESSPGSSPDSPPTSDVVQVQGPLRSSLSLPPLPEEGPADEEESDEDHKSSNDKSKSSSSSAGDDDSEELPPAHPDLQEPPPPHPDEVPLPHPSVQEPTPSESASDEPTTSESQKEPQAVSRPPRTTRTSAHSRPSRTTRTSAQHRPVPVVPPHRRSSRASEFADGRGPGSAWLSSASSGASGAEAVVPGGASGSSAEEGGGSAANGSGSGSGTGSASGTGSEQEAAGPPGSSSASGSGQEQDDVGPSGSSRSASGSETFEPE